MKNQKGSFRFWSKLMASLVIMISLMASPTAFLKTAYASDLPISSMVNGSAAQGLAPLPVDIYPIVCNPAEKTLLIQDNVPWFAPANQDPLGADATELKAQNVDFCLQDSISSMTSGLGQFTEIIISGGQSQMFYNDIFPDHIISPSLTDFVKNGGVLSANLADKASGPGNGGAWLGDTFVGGLTHVFSQSQNNNIVDPSSPIITGKYGGANGGRIMDTGLLSDLDGWSSSSNGYFTDLPADTKIILVDESNNPVMIEYPYGAGKVIATLTTTEWRYVGGKGLFPQNKKLLANEIGYQNILAGNLLVVPVDIKPGKGPALINLKSNGLILVAILSTSTFAARTVDPSSVRFGPNGAKAIRSNLKYVNRDGKLDLVLLFRIQQTGISSGDTQACLTGMLADGVEISGCDAIKIVPPAKK